MEVSTAAASSSDASPMLLGPSPANDRGVSIITMPLAQRREGYVSGNLLADSWVGS